MCFQLFYLFFELPHAKPCRIMWNHPKKLFLGPKRATFDKRCKSRCKKSTQIHWESTEIQSEAPTTSSHMHSPSMWEEVVGASLWISVDFQWIWVDLLHVDSHAYLFYLQSICRRQVLIAKPYLYFSFSQLMPFM